MSGKNHYTLHPSENALMDEFHYGNMLVRRRPIAGDPRHGKRMAAIFESYLKAGIFPRGTHLMGDYLEHTLAKGGEDGHEIAGRYLGIVLPGNDYQYVRLEGESIGVEKHKLSPPDEIDILTDTCLFCASNATATLKSGEKVSIVAPKAKITTPVKELHISERLCYYEMDAIARLTGLIRAMIEGNGSYRKAILAMPTVEYYFYLMGTYNKGLIEKSMMLEWIGQVNRHAEKIVRAITKRIGLKVEICQPLSAAEPYIRDRVGRGEPADFETVKEILSSGTKLWKEVISITNPKEWKDLNYTNYAVAVLESALMTGSENRLTIDIENPSEQKILRNAAKIARKLGQRGYEDRFRVIGIYPHEKVFIPSSDERSKAFPRLYYLEQSTPSSKSYFREIVDANRRKVDVHHREHGGTKESAVRD